MHVWEVLEQKKKVLTAVEPGTLVEDIFGTARKMLNKKNSK